MVRRFTLLIILLPLLFSALSLERIEAQAIEEVEGLSSEEGYLEIDLSPNPVGRGDRFTLTIDVPSDRSSEIEVEEPEIPEQFALIGGPYIRPAYEIDDEGRRLRKSRITYVYVSRESGRFELGRFAVTTPEGSYETEPQLLEVGLYRNRKLIVPPDIAWKISEETVYVGENSIWILEAEGLEDIRIFEDVDLDAPDEGFFEPVDGIGTIHRYLLGGRELYRQPVVEYLFTPSSPGVIELPGALVGFEGLRLSSEKSRLVIKPLPEEVEENGVVGDFELSSELSTESLRMGESLELSIRIEGRGNLNYLRLPPPDLEAWTVVREDEEESFEAGPAGYQGYREKVYTLSAQNTGEVSLKLPVFAAIDPESGEIYTLGGEEYRVEVEGAADGAGGDTPSEEFPFSPREIVRSTGEPPPPRYLDTIEYLWLLPGPVVFLIFFLLRRRKLAILMVSFLFLSLTPMSVEKSDLGSLGIEAYEAGEWKRSYSAYRSILEEEGNYPDAAFNLALAAYKMERIGEAVFFARSAVHSLPASQEYRDFLFYLEEEEELPQHGLFPWPIHPDAILLLLTLSLNFSGVIGVVYLFSRRNAYFIAASLLLVLSIALASALVYSASSRGRDVAVALTADVATKTIPRNDASDAFILKEGESVEVLGRSEPFLFIRTVLGRRGWVRAEHLGHVGTDYREIFDQIDVERRVDGFR